MAMLVLSSSKNHIVALKHTCCCVIAAILRILAINKAGLTFVLMYISLFISSFLVADFLPQDSLPLEPKWNLATLYCPRVQQHRYAFKMIHVFSIRCSKTFLNGGRIWKSGGCCIQFSSRCLMLKWVSRVGLSTAVTDLCIINLYPEFCSFLDN